MKSLYERSSDRYQAQIDRYGDQVMAALSPLHVEAALDTDSLYRFTGALGLPVGRLVILEDAQSPEAVEILTDHLDPLENGTYGQYFAYANIVVVDRAKATSQEKLESVAAHELGHTSKPTGFAGIKMIAEKTGLPVLPMMGFRTMKKGALLEEGFATLISGAWAQARQNAQGMIDNLYDPYPAKYSLSTLESYHHAALIWECLGAKNPKLVEPMFASRQHPQEMRKVAEEINRISSGLFRDLLNVQRGGIVTAGFKLHNFNRTLRTVLEITGIRQHNYAEIVENGPVASYMRTKVCNIAD